MTDQTILEQYDTHNDAFDDYLDAKERGTTCDTFETWFSIQFSKPTPHDNILDGPDVPPVRFDDDDTTGSCPSRIRRPPKSPSGGNSKDVPCPGGSDTQQLTTP